MIFSAAAVGDLRRAYAKDTLPVKLNKDTKEHMLRSVRRDQRLRCYRHWPKFDNSIAPGSPVSWDLLYRANNGKIDDEALPGIATFHTLSCRMAHSSTLYKQCLAT